MLERTYGDIFAQINYVRLRSMQILSSSRISSRRKLDSCQAAQKEGIEEELLPQAPKWPASPLFLATTVGGLLALMNDLFGEASSGYDLSHILILASKISPNRI